MDREKSIMLYVFGGPMDGLIVRALIEDGMPKVNTLGTGRSREYDVRELTYVDGMVVRAFVHRSLADEEAVKRYHAVTNRAQISRKG
jgi:hypothetical protein